MKIGDRVRLLRSASSLYSSQSSGKDGKVEGLAGANWVDVTWDNGHFNSYPIKVLEVLWDGPMPDPEFDLEEINQGSELYRKLEGR